MAEYLNLKRTAYQNINDLQKQIKKRDFSTTHPTAKDRKEIYTAIFAMRMGVNAQRNKSKTLKVEQTQKGYQDAYNMLINNQTFNEFLDSKNDAELKTLFADGHGGAAEDKFREFVKERDTLPTDVPGRYMPSAKERVEHLQGKLKNVSPNSPEATHIYSEMFRARRAVNAVRGKGSSLDSTITGIRLVDCPKLEQNATFQQFVKANGNKMKEAAAKGHGGAAEDLFKDHILHMEHIPADVPIAYAPDAKARTEEIQSKLKGNDYRNASPERRMSLYAELLGTRESVNAIRGNKASLEKPVDPRALNACTNSWINSKTFKDYVTNHEAEVRRAAAAGHGGALEDQIREHILNLDHLPSDVPPAALPQAMERTEALQKKLKSSAYNNRSPEEKTALYAELMGTRSAVGAKRGEKASLKQPIDINTLNRDVNKLANCQVFKDYIRDHEAEAKAAAISGHGGALDDAFKKHILSLDKIPADLPASYMPKAIDRTEGLQNTIRSQDLTGPENADRRVGLYAELMATREAVGAVRGNKESLKADIAPARLADAQEKWYNNELFRNFVRENEVEARQAALSGHGGALGDKFKEYICNLDRIPEKVPEGYLPTALERTEALKGKIKDLDDEPEREKALVAELFATRRSVDPIRGKKDSLDKPIDREKMLNTRDYLLASSTFQDFMDPAKNPDYEKIKDVAAMGHGGAAEDAFSDYVCNQDHIGTDVPEAYLPTGLQRTEALQKKIGSAEFHGMDKERKIGLMAELMATRDSVNAVRGNKRSLDYPVDPSALQESYKEYSENPTFRAFVSTAEANAVSGATRGHGGMLQDKFKEYVCSQTILPGKLPKNCAPTAQERIEALQKKIKDPGFTRLSGQEQKIVYTELAATRMAANAKRGDKRSLQEPLDLDAVGKARDQLSKSESFQNYLGSDVTIRNAALAGHGGELEDNFQSYVLKQNKIGADVPDRYMPNALDRTEAIQKKLNQNDLNQQERDDLNRELLATRGAVDAERGKKDSLRKPLDAQKLNQEREALEQSPAVTEFLHQQNPADLRYAACSGHGGALEDKLKESVNQQTMQKGILPDKVPARYQPKASELSENFRKDIQQKANNMSAQQMEDHKTELKQEIASSMFLYKWQKEHPGQEAQGIDPEEMKKSVKALQKSPAFNKMFDAPGATQKTMKKAVLGMSGIFDNFSRNEHEIRNAEKQRQRQLQQNRNRNLDRRNSLDRQRNIEDPELQQGRQRRNSMPQPQMQRQLSI